MNCCVFLCTVKVSLLVVVVHSYLISATGTSFIYIAS